MFTRDSNTGVIIVRGFPLLHQGIQLLERFAQDDRVRVRQLRKNLQIKFSGLSRKVMT